jgi:hypothetical protein
MSIPVKIADGTVLDEKLQDGPSLTVQNGRLSVEVPGKSAFVYVTRPSP